MLNTNLLVKRRYELGLRQQDLAEVAGTSPSHLSNIEAGKSQPGPQLLTRLADALGVSPADLLAEEVA